ncbi:4-hydroxy-tetrahydrodipicolinate reductase [Pseudoalteromonas denitrificans]|uniref:4-hydroxy-tetrahydrodipicolinate reductase n=1 Tax=Pseudoalteromonas denitrificans DSM 6059 TaxID=1123010 RepID=A0A1I1N8U0_9GAMM|nr:4-hydroxy-tetrahydrodipicolinate reductase [Pseudoalteromonas denitrificans]SFC94134.1 dihydrodipicolinate reductase [Pseudoalteromonas denitrificans DSM 6059]
MNRIGVFGANGRMGRALLEVISQDNNCQLSAFCRTGSDLIGFDLGPTTMGAKGPILLKSEQNINHNEIDVLIDFTLASGLKNHLADAVKNKTAMVIGTTGLTENEMLALEQASKTIPIVFARNFSVGINVLLSLVKTAATTLDENIDIEIFEAHHRNKIDAPSGTALAIGEAIADAKGWQHDKVAKFDRSSDEVAKTQNEIGYSVLRAGDIVGEHTAYFATMGERLELTHKASSRITFAQGAVRAAAWLKNKPPGLYTMQDVLSLHD